MAVIAYDLCVPTNLLTAAQVAGKLGVSKRRVLALISAGRLPATKYGQQFLIEPRNVAKVRHRKVGRPKGKVVRR